MKKILTTVMKEILTTVMKESLTTMMKEILTTVMKPYYYDERDSYYSDYYCDERGTLNGYCDTGNGFRQRRCTCCICRTAVASKRDTALLLLRST